jgi:CRISPR-associated endonuclease/helicase Cas3
MDSNDFVAHRRKADGEIQTVSQHLRAVSDIASQFSSKIGLPQAGRLIGLLHDFGKYSKAFQIYIKSATGFLNPDQDDEYIDSRGLKGKIDHSSAGSQYIWRELRKYGKLGQGELCGQILALCIASHHIGLIDCLSVDGEQTYFKRMQKDDEKTHLKECMRSADTEISAEIKSLACKSVVTELLEKIKQIIDLKEFPNNRQFHRYSKVESFAIGFLARFLFSCLIDADRLNSAEFEEPSRLKERIENNKLFKWQIAIDRFENKLASFKKKKPIDVIRAEISENCINQALGKQGIYTLTVPTGGGKTYASLRYALHHANKHGLDRIIYIIPYTSIIDQNAEAIREVIEHENDLKPWVLEHHSNLEPEIQTWRTKLIAENWDAPIVLTTMVQFLETLFSGGTRGVRRLHQLVRSVLIFDEIQTLPINCTHLFCNAINFLITHAKTTAILCTATQPLLDRLKAPEKGQLTIPKENELVPDVPQLFDDLKRVQIQNRCKAGGWQADEIAELALSEFRGKGSCLVIVNTKTWAQQLFQICTHSVADDAIFHLSTNQYPAHRKTLLDKIRKRLDGDQPEPVLCLSTQLIEAGVDVDFASVVRFLAGLDSIAQAAGRCNRNGRSPMATVHVVNPYTESTGMLTDIEVGKQKAQRVFSEQHEDWVNPRAMERYFQYYFFDRSDEMVYPLRRKLIGRDDNLLNLLSDNPQNGGIMQPVHKLPLLQQSFKKAGNVFKAIEAPTQSVIVEHGEGKAIVAELCAVAKEFDAKRYYELLRRAQKYSVNVFPNVWGKLVENHAVQETQKGDGIFYLKENYYSDEFGLSIEPVGSLSFLISD